MKPSTRHPGHIKKRRTTLTPPCDSLGRAERIARARKVNLSTVVSEALEEGLRIHEAAQRSEQILNANRRAFSGFTDAAIAVLDGIILEPAKSR